MTDETTGGSAPPPKKRSFFKKAAWQTKPKTDGEKEKDMFSHSSEYAEILADEASRKKERREKQRREEEEKKKLKAEEERRRKRRKVSTEEPLSPEVGPGNFGESASGGKTRSSGHDRSSLSPLSPLPARNTDTLNDRYESLTRASKTVEKQPSGVIDLSDSEPDVDDAKDTSYKGSSQRNIPQLPSKPAPSAVIDVDDDLEEVLDPRLAELAAKARARAANRAKESNANKTDVLGSGPQKETVVQLLIDSELENTKPLLVKIMSNSTLEVPRKAWCRAQGFTDQVTADIFFTWNMKRLFDSTKVERCGIRIDANGWVTVEGSTDIYDETNVPKIFLQAWTARALKEAKDREAREEEERKKAEARPALVEEPLDPEPAAQKKSYRLILKAKGKPDFKLTVHEDTTFERLASVYKQKLSIPSGEPITLMFDGDRLRPMDTIADADIDDLDALEVHFK
ncbi:hypothetical protein BU24DRAFT_464417 [Aaosphaeria arxii CBS 175.79]|uniref:Ubiquitin-like domain-containing protein n=1 Tax=Aaosphaeria arxii CBS 175.79 TaxID=1450172 RepID=A0A6A5XK46_9PLEO|nr:uncharacterized protein BU24DRAFT_464417 [Aaosphaeria arxii CBS 175.79]KAF2013658.1 hypothetical protein BU24DRAFT_464417 [Aaosphaeria arxii CBS 175.79]